jgi:hypothetical protein
MSDYSIFPKAIDGYAQLPLFVDNITPVNAEGLNRIRSAIVNIENALGITPQGEYITVSERLDSIDSGGLETIVERLDLIEAELDVVEAALADFPSDLATVLAAGNVTGGSNIIISTGDRIEGESNVLISSAPGSNVGLSASSGDVILSSDRLTLKNGANEADLIVGPTDPNGLVGAGAGSLALDTSGNLFVGQGGTSWNALANRFTKKEAVFDAAETLPELYDFLAETSRPFFDTDVVPDTIYVDSVSGDDEQGDGSLANPFATFKRAYQVIAINPLKQSGDGANRVIQLQGAGPYDAGAIYTSDLNFVTVRGEDPTIIYTGNIDALSGVGLTTGEADGIIIDDSSLSAAFPALSADELDDELRGKIIKFTAADSGGTIVGTQYGIISTVHSKQYIVVSQDTTSSAFRAPAAGGGETYEILDWVTEFSFPYGAANTLSSCSSSKFESLKFTIGTAGGFTNCFLFCTDTSKIEFVRCRLELSSIIAGRGGSIFLTTSSIANKGYGFSDHGMVSAITQGIIKIQNGTLVDGVNSGGTADWISALSLGLIESRGEVSFREIGANTGEGITVRGGSVVTLNNRQGPTFNIWRFIAGSQGDNCLGGVVANNLDEGWGWSPLDLPDLHGYINADFSVKATGGAKIRLGAGSTVEDNGSGGITTVSADDGVTESSEAADGTFIQGGVPAASGAAFIKDIETGVRQFVFQPSGTASNGVYTSWSDLYTDLAASTAPVREVILDDSALGAYPDPVKIPPGTYDFSGVKIVGRPSERPGNLGFLEIELETGATIENCAGIKNILLINHGGLGPTPPAKGSGIFSFNSGALVANAQYFEIDRCFLGSLSNNKIIDVSNSTFLVALFKNRSLVGANSTAITVNGGSSLDFRLIGGSRISDDCIADTGSAGTLSYSHIDAGSTYNLSQASFFGTKPTEAESTVSVQYSPTNPGDWSSPPNNVKAALDSLAAGAIVAGGIGGSTGSTDNAVLRANGVGGSTLQSSGVTIDDSDSLNVPGAVTVTGYTEMKGGRKIGRTAVDHTVAHSLDHTTDGILGCNTTTGAVTINLFDPALISPSSEVDGYMVTIKDEAGNASSNNITINGAAGYTIDGSTSITISINYASVTLYSDGANWFVI